MVLQARRPDDVERAILKESAPKMPAWSLITEMSAEVDGENKTKNR